MTSQTTASVMGEPIRPSRQARALIGFMQPEEATLVLNGRQQGLALTPEQQARYESATAAVAARVAGADQTDLVLPVPATLEAHVSALRSHPLAALYFAEGWEVQLVDLSRVCAFQPQVNVEAAVERVESVDVDDLDSIAHATLPLSVASPVSPGFDPTKNAFMVVSPNPNLRVTGVFSAQLDPNRPDILGVGFSVQVLTSFVSVASVNGRYYLRDGYHRSLGLIREGSPLRARVCKRRHAAQGPSPCWHVALRGVRR